MSLAIIWLIVLVVCLVAEIATLGLTSIWFAGGALLALLIAMIGGPLWLQVLVFLVASIVLLIVTRPIAAKYFNELYSVNCVRNDFSFCRNFKDCEIKNPDIVEAYREYYIFKKSIIRNWHYTKCKEPDFLL